MEIKPDEIEVGAKIKVVGIGGSGGSSIARMISAGLQGVQFIAINTDAQALHHSPAQTKVHIGKQLTRGLGAGANPDIGRRAAEEDSEEIYKILNESDLIFMTYGLGGGTGTGAGPVIAEIAKETGALVVAVLTLPFTFEGFQRTEAANRGLKEIQEKVDTLIVIPNDKILEIVDSKTTMIDAFRVVDDVLHQGVKGIAELITVPGLINLDFADVKSIMKDAGTALMGIGMGTGEGRALQAAKQAVQSPLLNLTINGAKGVLFNIMAGPDITMDEVKEAAMEIKNAADPQAKIIFGAMIDEAYQGQVKITIIATGFDKAGAGILQETKTSAQSSQIQNPFAGQQTKKPSTNPFEDNSSGQGQQNPPDLDDSYSIPAYLRENQ